MAGFTQLSNDITYGGHMAAMSGRDFLVYVALLSFSDRKTRLAQRKMKDIATMAGVSIRQAQRSVKDLVANGYIAGISSCGGRGSIPTYEIVNDLSQLAPLVGLKGDTTVAQKALKGDTTVAEIGLKGDTGVAQRVTRVTLKGDKSDSRDLLVQRYLPEKLTTRARTEIKKDDYPIPEVDNFDRSIVDKWITAFRELDGRDDWSPGDIEGGALRIAQLRTWGTPGCSGYITPDRYRDKLPIGPEDMSKKSIAEVMNYIVTNKNPFHLKLCLNIEQFCLRYGQFRLDMRADLKKRGTDPDVPTCPNCSKPLSKIPESEQRNLKPEYQGCEWRCRGNCRRPISQKELQNDNGTSKNTA